MFSRGALLKFLRCTAKTFDEAAQWLGIDEPHCRRMFTEEQARRIMEHIYARRGKAGLGFEPRGKG